MGGYWDSFFLKRRWRKPFLGSSAGVVVVGVVAAGLGWAFSRSTGALTRPLPLVPEGSFSGCWNLVKSSMDGRIVGELTR